MTTTRSVGLGFGVSVVLGLVWGSAAEGPANTELISTQNAVAADSVPEPLRLGGPARNVPYAMPPPPGEKPVLVARNIGDMVPEYPSQGGDNPPVPGSRSLAFDLSPGTGAPPGTLGGFLMTDFPLDDSSGVYVDITSIPSPCAVGGDIEFSTPMSHRRIGSGWGSWSHGYTEDVYFTDGATSVTITLPQLACAFYFYVEPNPFSEIFFTATASDGTSSGSFSAHGSAGATYVGVYGSGLEWVTISTDDGTTDFAIGEFGIGCFCEPMYLACCDEATGDCDDSVEVLTCIEAGGRWEMDVEYCADLVPACGEVTGACCVGPAGEPPYDPYECIGDMTMSDCLFAGEETIWYADQSCEGASPYGCEEPGLLYAPTQPDDPAFRAAIEEQIGKTCDYFDPRYATPTLEELQGYVAVFTWVNYPYADNVAMGDVLADYVDAGGIVILGQWTLHTTQNNWLEGRIMTAEYCPVTGLSYTGDCYAGDGYGCATWDVGSFGSSYFDQVTAAAGAFHDGTTCNGSDFVCYWPMMDVWYSPGNTGLDYTAGDVVELTASMYACGAFWRTACCHPTEYDPATGAGVCENRVHPEHCMPPLEFHSDQTCASLHPPCGNPGACCDTFTGECNDPVLELNCDADRFEPGQQCAELDPACGTVVGACCMDNLPPGEDPPGECTIEFQANCAGRFVAGAVCDPDPFDPPCGEWECSGILYAPSDADNPTWRAQVAALCGCNVDYWDARISTPTLEDLRDYCCVFTWANYAYAGAILFGDTLAAYVDLGGRVILGQWTFDAFSGTPGAGGSVIVEPEYCPVTVSFWSVGTYAGDGTDCVHILGPVSEYASSYCDQASPRPGAVTDGTFLESGLPAVIWRADRHLYYSPGNTGGDYTTGDTAQLVANMAACTDDPLEGACCDPTNGACTNGVMAADCMPPLEFHYQQTCETLDPPCGNPGCCCADHPPAEGPPPGEAWQEFEVNCEEGRFLPGVLGEDCHLEAFTPPCGEYEACDHSITMWDDYGDGWNGGYIDVYVDGELVLAGVTLASGSGPGHAYFEAETCDTIETTWTGGGWPYEASYCIYDGLGDELGCDGLDGEEPAGITVTGNCEPPMIGGCCLGYDGCLVLAEPDCPGVYLGDFTDCGDMADCDGDGMTDLCAITAYEGPDCNSNGIPDECDIAAGTSEDDNGDGVPDECTALIPLDIKPGSCPNPFNRSSHGVLPVALVGTIGFDMTTVDVSTVVLARADAIGGEVAPNEGPPGPHSVFEDVATPFEGEACDCHDLAGDGIVDLSVKFKTDDVVEVLLLDDLPAGALVDLVVSGYLLDGTAFEGGDCVRLVPPGTAGALLAVESSVAGAWVDLDPLDETLDGGGFADFVRSMPLTTVVTLTAEEWAQGRPLRGWQIGGLLHHMGQTSVEFVVDQDMTVSAVYGPTPSGSPKPPGEMTPDEMVPEAMQGQSAEAGTIDRR